MTKAELIEKIAEKSGASKKDSKAVLDAAVEAIAEALAAGEKVQLSGLGTFDVKAREARTCHKPGTTETVEVPATTVPVFRAAAGLKAAVAK